MTSTTTTTTTTTNRSGLQVGDTVCFPCPHDNERGRVGKVTKVLGSTHLATRVRTETVFVTTSDGDEFHGPARFFRAV
jgi:hypothetical protein